MSQQSLDEYKQARAGALQQPHLAHQELYFREPRNLKRAAPSPTVSGLTTPQEQAANVFTSEATPQDGATLVQPVFLKDQTALQAVASDFGVNVNDPAAVEAFYQTPVQTASDVIKLVRGYSRLSSFGKL